MSSGGSGGTIGKIKTGSSYLNPTAYIANRAAFVGSKALATGRGVMGAKGDVQGDLASTYMGEPPESPDPNAAPTMEDIAAMEPDKERKRRQRMAARMAQGRQGTILTGPGGTAANNTIGGGGKQLVGA